MIRSTLSALARRWRRPARRPEQVRLRLEAMEDRCVPALLIVNSPADNINQMGTLRWAVAHANNGDTIAITTTQPIVLTQGELYLANSVNIESGVFSSFQVTQVTVSGDHLSRIFEVAPAGHVNLDYLHLIDGVGLADNPGGTAAADGYGGAILNQGTLALTACSLQDNGSTVGTFGPPTTVIAGGGILNNANPAEFGTPNPVGDLTLTRCRVDDNTAQNAGGGIDNLLGSAAVLLSTMSGNNVATGTGGGISSSGGILVLASSEFDHDAVMQGDGGGVAGVGGLLFVLACQLQFNAAHNEGGGVYHHNSGFLTIGSTYFDNSAMDGAGIANTGNGATMGVFNCTFMNNQATAFGGGIFNGPGAFANVDTSNLIDNSAGAGGGIYNYMAGTLNLGFSLLQTNTPDNLDNQGTYNDLGGNTFI